MDKRKEKDTFSSTAAALLCLLLVFAALVGCQRKTQVTVYEPSTQTTAAQTASASFSVAATDLSAAPAAETTSAETPTVSAVETTATDPVTATAQATSAAAAQAEEEGVTLPIELPEANGTMEVSVDPQNVLIRTISEARGLDASLLAAVYAVPRSGQNYVFEFNSAGDRSASALRRVYLLTDALEIKSVAASNAAEREQISLTENWFCMNVLIKGVIFPSVQDKMQ